MAKGLSPSLLLLFRICAPILVMSLLHKTKDSFKGGKEITNYFTQKQSLRKIWPLKKKIKIWSIFSLSNLENPHLEQPQEAGILCLCQI